MSSWTLGFRNHSDEVNLRFTRDSICSGVFTAFCISWLLTKSGLANIVMWAGYDCESASMIPSHTQCNFWQPQQQATGHMSNCLKFIFFPVGKLPVFFFHPRNVAILSRVFFANTGHSSYKLQPWWKWPTRLHHDSHILVQLGGFPSFFFQSKKKSACQTVAENPVQYGYWIIVITSWHSIMSSDPWPCLDGLLLCPEAGLL